MKEISKSFADSLAININDLGIDLLEVGLDSVLDDGILKEIPVIKPIVGVAKVGLCLRERNLMIRLVEFINELNSGSIDKDKLAKHQKLLNSNSNYAEKELGRVILLLDRMIDTKKSVILAKLYKTYINEKISWEEFCEYSEINNRMFIEDLDVFINIWYGRLKDSTDINDKFRIERLNSLGLIALTVKSITSTSKKMITDNYITFSKLGKEFAKVIFENY